MKRMFIIALAFTLHTSNIHSMEKVEQHNKKHLVYHPGYDITFFGIERVHPFDSAKYSKIAQFLVEEQTLNVKDFHTPQEITDEDLAKVHTQDYLKNLHHCASAMFAKASGITPLALLPNMLIRWRALYPMRLATGGTVEAMELALQNGWAINLSGGYHHAKSNDCDGFCVYADAPLAAYKAIEEHSIAKILVIDLDAHQGNGNEDIFSKMECFKNKVDVFDVYGKNNYPGFSEHILMDNKSWYNHPVELPNVKNNWHHINDTEYLKILTDHLPTAIEKSKPGLIIYNAGSDIYEKDRLGSLGVTEDGIVTRDEYVFRLARDKKIPIMMMLSGGYTEESAEITSESIKNIITERKNADDY